MQKKIFIAQYRKWREDRNSAWLCNDQLVKLKDEKDAYRQWKQEHMAWEKYRDAVQTCRDENRKTKAQMGLNLARNVKNNVKGFYRYSVQRRQTKECITPLINKKGHRCHI